MTPLLEELYRVAAERWNTALGLLGRDEYTEYQLCGLFSEEQRERLSQQLTGDQLAAWDRYLANAEQVHETECRLFFAHGLSMGPRLAGLSAGE